MVGTLNQSDSCMEVCTEVHGGAQRWGQKSGFYDN